MSLKKRLMAAGAVALVAALAFGIAKAGINIVTEREEPDSRDFDKARYSGCDGPIRSLLTR